MDYWEETAAVAKFWTNIWHVTMHGPYTQIKRSEDQTNLIELIKSLLESDYPLERLAELAKVISLSHKIGEQNVDQSNSSN